MLISGSVVLPLFLMILLPAELAFCFSNWPASGQQHCYGAPVESDENIFATIDCPADDSEDFFGQDNQYRHLQLSRHYTKLDAWGNELADDAERWFMVRDDVTGLIWEVKSDDGSIHDHDNTYVWCDPEAENKGECPTEPGEHAPHTREFIVTLNNSHFGGADGGDPARSWRIPTIQELTTLIHADQPESAATLATHPSIDVAYFPHARPYEEYWSATSDSDNGEQAWYLSATLGNTYHDKAKSERLHVRAVMGVPPQAPSGFTDNGDQTVTDNVTGLMWQRNTQDADLDQNGTTTWREALAYCESLQLAGHTDWRLPNRMELLSLVEHSQSPALGIQDDNLAGILFPHYWTSTTNIWHPWRAWLVDFTDGKLQSQAKSTYNGQVRAVRGRQKVNLTLRLAGRGAGHVVSRPAGIDCPDDCSEIGTYHAGDKVILTAVAHGNDRFIGWSGGNCSGVAPSCTVSMNRSLEVTATFAEPFSWHSFFPAIFSHE